MGFPSILGISGGADRSSDWVHTPAEPSGDGTTRIDPR